MTDMVSLYVHVPFCAAKCAYCDFLSVSLGEAGSPMPPGADPRTHFVAAAVDAIRTAESRGVLDQVPTAYIGGGTPTVLGDGVVEIVGALRGLSGFAADAELTVEANPESVTEPLVEAVLAAGANRFSLGIQSFDDSVLETLGRCHDSACAVEAARVMSDAGARFSVDLICGVPGLSDETWADTLEQAIATGAGHLSVYPLTLEPGTRLWAEVVDGRLGEVDADEAGQQMEMAARFLAEAGFERYEIASFSRRGEQSRHNRVYWTGGSYLGIGPSAASMLDASQYAVLTGREAPKGSRVRFVATADPAEFAFAPTRFDTGEIETLNAAEALREDAMLGLRLTEGITVQHARDAAVDGVLEGFVAVGLVEGRHGRYRLTERGWLLGNEVFSAVWAGS